MKTANQMHRQISKEIDKFLERLEKKYYGQEVIFDHGNKKEIVKVDSLDLFVGTPFECIREFNLTVKNSSGSYYLFQSEQREANQ